MKKDYLDQVRIPEGMSGKHRIEHFKHPAGKKLDTSNFRTSVMGGQHNKPVTYKHETTWHQLSYSGGVWMTDLPIEQQQHRNCLYPMSGDILIGGLGIGLAANWLAQKEGVTGVTVVEISADVIKLVAPHIRDPRKIVKVVHSDLLDYLKKNKGKQKFDWAFYDIWQSDGESTFFKTVCPLRKLSVQFVDDRRVVCWNEDVMRGQLYMGLQTRYLYTKKPDPNSPITLEKLAHPKKDDIWLNWSAPFFQAVERGEINDANLQSAISTYVRGYGRPNFSREWAKLNKAERMKA